MPNEYDVGDIVRIRGNFTDTGGVAANPAVVNAWVKAPSSTVLVLSGGDFTNTTVGTFTYDLTIDSSGTWIYRFWSTGTLQASEQASFLVRRMLVASTGT